MAVAPVIEFRNSTTPFAVITTLALSGSGTGSSIPVGSTSSIATFRIYNNFSAAASIADATGCVIACYDDTVHQGSVALLPTSAHYVQVNIADYNGVTTGSDGANYFGIGGQAKHLVPTNTGTLAGAGANYITVNIRVQIPTTATQGAVSQGVWIEYNSTA